MTLLTLAASVEPSSSDRRKSMDEKELIQMEIGQYKLELAGSDYKVLKYLEGQLSEDEYLEIKEKRIEWRKRINELEERL
jgi:hypothetical protein